MCKNASSSTIKTILYVYIFIPPPPQMFSQIFP